jgi:hypothetical protein
MGIIKSAANTIAKPIESNSKLIFLFISHFGSKVSYFYKYIDSIDQIENIINSRKENSILLHHTPSS